MTEAEIQERRIYVGGLFPSIKPSDINDKFSKFGNVSSVEIKVRKNECGAPDKTFAYVDFLSTKGNWQKCLSTFNHTKWKGSELKLELAKSSFLDTLEEERRAKKDNSPPLNTPNSHLHNPLKNLANPNSFELRGAVPGTPIPGEKDWVVGKYGRILPILRMKKDGKQKLITADPSKFCHNLKKLKDDNTKNVNTANLTWEINHKDSAITKKRKGEFKSWTPRQKKHTDENYLMLKKFYDKRLQQSQNGGPGESDSDEFEVVKVSSQVSDGEESVGSADTDEIIANVKLVNKQTYCNMAPRRQLSAHSGENTAGLTSIDNIKNKSNEPSTLNSAVKKSDSLPLQHKSDLPTGGQHSAINTKDLSFLNRCSDSSSLYSESNTQGSDAASDKRKTKCSVLKRKSALASGMAIVDELKYSAAKQMKSSKVFNTKQEKNVTSISMSSTDSCDVLDFSGKHSSLPTTSLKWNRTRVPEFKGLSMLNSDSEDNDISTQSWGKFDSHSLRNVNKITGEKDVSAFDNSLKQITKSVHEELDLTDSDSISSTNTDEIISNAKKNFNTKYFTKSVENTNETLNSTVEYDTGFSIISGDIFYTQRKLMSDDVDGDFVKLSKLVTRTDKKIMSSTPKPVDVKKNNTLGFSLDEPSSCVEPLGRSMVISGSKSYVTPTQTLTTVKQITKSTVTVVGSTLESECEKKLLQDSDTSQLKENKSPSKLIKSSVMSDKKHAEDNEKRLLSMMERQRENLMQKEILKKALSSVDGVSSNKKIVFDSDDDSDPPSIAEPPLTDSKTNSSKKQQIMNIGPSLFDSAEENADDNGDMFRLRKQYEGKSGRKLMSLQSRIGSDERFRLDERFADSEEDNNTDNLNSDDNAEESEKARSLKILESVVGREKLVHLQKQDSKKKLFKDIAAVRFDPSQEDHSQFEIKRTNTEINKNAIKPEKHKKKVKKSEEEVVEENRPEVDKTRHFEVSAALKDAFKNSESQTKTSFSLLSAFGVHKSKSESSDEEDVSVKTTLSQLPWKTEDNSEEELMSGSDVDQDGPDAPFTDSKPGPPKVIFPVKKWTFFFTADDERLKEGVQYFQRPADYESVVRSWREKRPELIDAYKIKHKRALKKLHSKRTEYRK